jgi:hypothetical protein
VGHKFCKDLQPLKKFEQGLWPWNEAFL